MSICMCNPSGSLSLAELGTMMPKSGGDYVYILEAYGGPVAFIHAWSTIFFLRPSGAAILSMTAAEYIMAGFFNDGCGLAPGAFRKLTAVWFICKSTFIFNCITNIVSTAHALKMDITFILNSL